MTGRITWERLLKHRYGGERQIDAEIAEAMKDPEFREAYEDATERHRIIDSRLALRRTQGLTQALVAERMGVGQPTVSAFESEASNPSIATLMRYARAVGSRLSGVLAEPEASPLEVSEEGRSTSIFGKAGPHPVYPCADPECPGDGRYAPPGRGHRDGCASMPALMAASPPETGGEQVPRCSRCGHMPHQLPCLNMASDNDCDCPGGFAQPSVQGAPEGAVHANGCNVEHTDAGGCRRVEPVGAPEGDVEAAASALDAPLRSMLRTRFPAWGRSDDYRYDEFISRVEEIVAAAGYLPPEAVERVRAQAAAQALREAADAYLAEYGTWGGASQGQWLHDRAARLDPQDTQGGEDR